MADESNDVSRALAAFGAPAIRYHSFGQGKHRLAGGVVARRVAPRPAPAPVAAPSVPAPSVPAPSVPAPSEQPAAPLLRQEQPVAAPELLPTQADLVAAPPAMAEPRPDVRPVSLAPLTAVPPREVVAPEPVAAEAPSAHVAPPSTTAPWESSIYTRLENPPLPAPAAPPEASGRRMHQMIAPTPFPEIPSQAAVRPGSGDGADRRLAELFAFLAGMPALGIPSASED